MTANGKIESFDDTNEKSKTYVELEEEFSLANNVDDVHIKSTDFELTFCRGIFLHRRSQLPSLFYNR